MGICSSTVNNDDEDPPSPRREQSPRRVQYTRSRFTKLTGNKIHPLVNIDIWREELLELVRNYKGNINSEATNDSFPTAEKDERETEQLVLDECSNTVAMFWSS